MFLSHIALSLELISLAVGAILILKSCCYGFGYHCHSETTRGETTRDTSTGETYKSETHKSGRKHHNFLKFIGYFVVILSFLALLCTAISYFYYLSEYGFMSDRYDRYHDNKERIMEPRNHRVPDLTPPPPLPRPEHP